MSIGLLHSRRVKRAATGAGFGGVLSSVAAPAEFVPASVQNATNTTPRQRGFTLIELLIALSIFALVSMMAFGGLNTVLDASARTEVEAARLIELQRAFALMRRDFEAAVNRPIRDQFGDEEPPMDAMDTEHVRFTRGGRDNPLGLQRSALERIAYGLDDQNRLIRSRWRALDQPIDPQFDELVMIEDVENFSVRYLNGDKEWQEFWPPAGVQQPGLPHAVEVVVEVEPYGEIRRLFVLPF